jgi:hypothetical protein
MPEQNQNAEEKKHAADRHPEFSQIASTGL